MTKQQSTDFIDHNLPVLSVSEISDALKRTVEESFARVRVRGEISGFKRAASGHLYFTLKDQDSVIDGVCWRGTAGRLSLNPEDGMEIVATGHLTTYAGRSKYQIVVDDMELAGEGALLKLLEDRRRKLTAEGLFDEDAKQALPYLPDVIGVVTSPTGAVIQDILHRIEDRFPRRVLLWPVLVQGDAAADQVAAAIRGFNALKPGGRVPRPDLLIVARGGGSLEDLWAFNEESVVRAAAESDIPLISAVGHETDTTLIDFASDQRAPTPTAAAELAVPVRAELVALVYDDDARLRGAMNRMLTDRRAAIEGLARGLPNLTRMIEGSVQRLDDWSERLTNSLRVGVNRRRAKLAELSAGLTSPKRQIEHGRSRLESEVRALKTASRTYLKERTTQLRQASALLESYSYQRVLDRGFALVADADGAPVASSKVIEAGMDLTITFKDGPVDAVATGKGGGGGSKPGPTPRPTLKSPAKPSPKAKAQKKPSDDRQGELL